MLYNANGFALALGPTLDPIVHTDWIHFGVGLPAGVLRKTDDLGVFANGHPVARRVVLDDADGLAVMREAVEIVARVGVAGQLDRPVGELESEGVPALRADPVDMPL